jgi:hypothetical protein
MDEKRIPSCLHSRRFGAAYPDRIAANRMDSWMIR